MGMADEATEKEAADLAAGGEATDQWWRISLILKYLRNIQKFNCKILKSKTRWINFSFLD